jgi:hypothetical protein
MTPTPREQTMLDDFKDRRLDHVRDLEAALLVGGPRDPEEIEEATRTLDAALRAATRDVATLAAEERPRALLRALYVGARGGRALLRQYQADETTLYDAVRDGGYNCVSATILYVLAARRSGVDARPVLLPSHARAVVVTAGGQHVVVETTDPQGYDPPAQLQEEMRARTRPKLVNGRAVDLYPDENGTEVDFAALLGAVYGNLAVMSLHRGDVALASALSAREATLTPPGYLPVVRMQQMALLVQLATSKYKEGALDEALSLARRAYDVAPDAKAKSMAEQTLTAVAYKQLQGSEAHLDDAELAAYADAFRAAPHAHDNVQALALSLLAQRKFARGDTRGGTAAMQAAASTASSKEIREAFEGGARKVSAYQLAEDGRCRELEDAKSELDDPASTMAYCHARRGESLFDARDYAAAATEMREAYRLAPREKAYRQSLIAVLGKYAAALAGSSRCDEARAVTAEGRALAPTEPAFDVISCTARASAKPAALAMPARIVLRAR